MSSRHELSKSLWEAELYIWAICEMRGLGLVMNDNALAE